ncbi:MAG: ATP-grasp domain-containing protein [Planctomycetota bacterium]|nr:ATP-grasp domain-containing protein [Planctomycetota bacterium]
MKDAIVSVAAGTSQLALIRAAKRLGYAVIAVDRDPNAPGFAEADATVVASTHDPDQVLAGVLPLRERFRVCGVLAKSSGEPVATAARLARELDCRGLDPDIARLSTSKTGFDELCRERGVARPESVREARMVGPRSVLKPARTGVGKEGVFLVRGEERLRELVARPGASPFLVEEFVEGEDVTLCMLFRDGEPRTIALLDERVRFDADGEARGLGVAVPSRWSGTEVEDGAVELGERIAAGAGTGICFLSMRATSQRRVVAIEAHFDLAGDFVADELFGAAGYDLIGATVRLHADGVLPEAPPRLVPSAVRFLYREEAPRAAELGRIPGVLRVETGLPPTGARGGGRIGFVLARAESGQLLEETLSSIESTLESVPER